MIEEAGCKWHRQRNDISNAFWYPPLPPPTYTYFGYKLDNFVFECYYLTRHWSAQQWMKAPLPQHLCQSTESIFPSHGRVIWEIWSRRNNSFSFIISRYKKRAGDDVWGISWYPSPAKKAAKTSFSLFPFPLAHHFWPTHQLPYQLNFSIPSPFPLQQFHLAPIKLLWMHPELLAKVRQANVYRNAAMFHSLLHFCAFALLATWY